MNGKNTIGLASVTWAMKAQDALRAAGIDSTLVRLRPGQSPRGCSWGVETAQDAERALSVLRGAGIPHNLLER